MGVLPFRLDTVLGEGIAKHQTTCVVVSRPGLAASVRMGVEVHPYRGKPLARAANTTPIRSAFDDLALPQVPISNACSNKHKGTPGY